MAIPMTAQRGGFGDNPSAFAHPAFADHGSSEEGGLSLHQRIGGEVQVAGIGQQVLMSRSIDLRGIGHQAQVAIG